MPWNDLASNQMVSYTDAQGGGFTLQPGQSAVTSNQCMTKSDATTKYVLDTSYLTSYASNQLIPKSVWVAGSVTITVNWSYNVGVCSGDSFNITKNGTTVVGPRSIGGSGTFTVVVGDALVVSTTSGIKGLSCADPYSEIIRNGSIVASQSQSGFSVTAVASWTVTSGTTSINCNGTVGSI
jgi:hypothetical protein